MAPRYWRGVGVVVELVGTIQGVPLGGSQGGIDLGGTLPGSVDFLAVQTGELLLTQADDKILVGYPTDNQISGST